MWYSKIPYIRLKSALWKVYSTIWKVDKLMVLWGFWAQIERHFFHFLGEKRPDPARTGPARPTEKWPRKMTVFACVGRQKCDFKKWWWKSTDSCCEKAEKTANFYAAWSIIHVRSVSYVRHPRPFNFMSTFQSYSARRSEGVMKYYIQKKNRM